MDYPKWTTLKFVANIIKDARTRTKDAINCKHNGTLGTFNDLKLKQKMQSITTGALLFSYSNMWTFVTKYCTRQSFPIVTYVLCT